MTLYTSEYLLPYPEAADSPCILVDVLNEAAEKIGGGIAALGAQIDDLVDRPAVRLSVQNLGPFDISGYNDFVTFQSVDFDARGTVDLDADDASLVPTEDAIWITGCHMYLEGVSDSSVNRCTCGPNNLFSARDSSAVVGGDSSLFSATGTERYDTSDYINMHVYSSAGAVSVTMVRAYLWMVRLSLAETY